MGVLQFRAILTGAAVGFAIGVGLSYASPWLFSALVAEPLARRLAADTELSRAAWLVAVLPRYFAYSVFTGLVHYIPAGYAAGYLADRAPVLQALGTGVVLAAFLTIDFVRLRPEAPSPWEYLLIALEVALALGLSAFGGKIREIQTGRHPRSGRGLRA